MTTSLLNSLLRALLRWGAALVFCLPLRHRPHFWARACGMLLPLLLLAQLLDPLAQSTTLWQQQLLLLVLYVSFFALLGGMIYLCTDINKKGALYCAVWSLLIAQCAYESWCFLELQFTRYGHPLNMASPWAVLVQLLSGAIFFAAVYILLARQLPYKGEYHIGPRQLFSAFFIGILFMVQAAVLDNARAEHTPLSLTVTILIGQFYFITLLYFQSELFKKSAMEKEMNELNLLYERQRQQYQVARQNVQIINKRCHELKVQIANLRKLSPEAVPQERIDEAERAARLYDANRNTGNEVLDVVLTEKSLLCESRGIQLNAVANGSCLGFFEAGDLYALFANALDHAVESAVHQGERQCKIRNNKLEKYYGMDFGKEELEHEFEINVRRAKETESQHRSVSPGEPNAFRDHLNAEERASAEKRDHSETERGNSIKKRDHSEAERRNSIKKRGNSEAQREDRDTERERLRAEESRRIESIFGRNLTKGRSR